MLFLYLSINSCQRKEPLIKEPTTNKTERFFSKTVIVNPQVKHIYDVLKRQNEQTNFVNKLPENAGYPIWDKVKIIKEATTTVRNSTTDTTLTAIIPLSNDNSYLASLLKIEETVADTFNLSIYTNQYFYNKTHSNTLNIAEAKSLLSMFLQMDNYTFGRKDFHNIPKALFPQTNFGLQGGLNTSVHLDSVLTNANNRSAVGELVTVSTYHCPWQTGALSYYNYGQEEQVCEPVCDVFDGCTQPIGSIGRCYIISTTTIGGEYDPGQPIGGGANNMGTGGTSTGGTSSGGTATGTGGSGTSTSGTTSTTPWYIINQPLSEDDLNNDGFPDIYQPYTVNNISDSLNNFPCVKALANEIAGINGNLTNNITKVIKNTFNKNTKFNITYVPRNLNYNSTNITGLTGNENITWTHSPSLNTWTSPLSGVSFKLKIDTSFMRSASKVVIAQTLLHESLHAYFRFRQYQAFGNTSLTDSLNREFGFLMPVGPYTPGGFSVSQHEQMASTYVLHLANALKELFPLTLNDINSTVLSHMPQGFTIDDYYKAIAWNGLKKENNNILTGWNAFSTNNPQLAQAYSLVLMAELAASGLNSIPKCN